MALFGKKTQSAPIQAVRGPEKVAAENPYLGREPIINRDQAIIGYELFFRPGTTLKAKRINERNEVLAQIAKRLEADPKAQVTYPDEITDANLRDDDGNEIKEVTLSEMLYALKAKGVAQSLGAHLGFIKIHPHQVGDELRGIPAAKFPLEINLAEILEAIQTEASQDAAVEEEKKEKKPVAKDPNSIDERKVPEILVKLEKLSNVGYKFVLTGLTKVFDGLEAILPNFRYVKLELHQVESAASLIEFCKATPLPRDTKSPAKKGAKVDSDGPVMQIIATHVETSEDFHQARDFSCDAYEGFYFIKPDPELSLHRGDDYRKILKLLTLLLASPELHELVDEIEANPVVAKHLMVIAEVDSRRRRAKPENVRDAAVISGVKRITRWTQLLLYADSKAKVSLESTPLLQLVCVRAFFMELASDKLPAGAGLGSSDLAFLVGGLSLIDNLFDDSSREILSKFNLPGVVVDAIADRSGVLGKLLSLAEAAELGDIEKCQQLCSGELGSLTLDDVALDSLLAIKTFVAQTQLAPDDDVWEQAEATDDE